MLAHEVHRAESAYVITDVIGTSTTIKAIINCLQNVSKVDVLSIVDATENNNEVIVNSVKYNIKSITKCEVKYYNDLPKGWLYSEICQVDPVNHILIYNSVPNVGPLWKSVKKEQIIIESEVTEIYKNEFIDDVILPISAVYNGHFSAGSRHITYLYDIPKLVKEYVDNIVDVIELNVNETVSKMTSTKLVTHVFYPDFNPGVNKLAIKVSSKYPMSKLIPVTYEEFVTKYDQSNELPDIETVIAIDDAFVTGDTVFRMIDICERKGAKNILMYILIKRGDEYMARRVEKISQYGAANVQVRYLADAEIPTYPQLQCPICSKIDVLKRISHKFKQMPALLEILQNEIVKDELKPISIVINNNGSEYIHHAVKRRSEKTRLRWTLEKAIKDPLSRNLLAKIVRNTSDVPNILNLLHVLSYESDYFLNKEHIKNEIFYPSFVKDLVKSCSFLLDKDKDINCDDLSAILTVLSSFDKEYLIDNLGDIITKNINDTQKFCKIILHLFTSENAHDYPARLKNVFTNIDINSSEPNIRNIFNNLIIYWDAKDEELSKSRKLQLEYYQKLSGGVFHEIGHLKDNLLGDISMPIINIERINSSWRLLHQLICTTIPLLRIFIGNNITTITCNLLHDCISRLVICIDTCEITLEQLNMLQNKCIDDLYTETTTSFHKQLSLLSNIIYAHKGIRSTLNKFRTNIKHSLYNVLEQQSAQIANSNILITKNYPDEAFLAFGEEIILGLIFQNIIENVWKNNKNVHLHIEVNCLNKEFINILFFDDGIGLNQEFSFGDGLNFVKRSVEALCGNFEVRNIDKKNDVINARWSTCAKVELPLLNYCEEI